MVLLQRRFEIVMRFAVLLVFTLLAVWTFWLVRWAQMEFRSNPVYEGRYFAERLTLADIGASGQEQTYLHIKGVETDTVGSVQMLKLTEPLVLSVSADIKSTGDAMGRVTPWDYWIQANKGTFWIHERRLLLSEQVYAIQLAAVDVPPSRLDAKADENPDAKQPIVIESAQMTLVNNGSNKPGGTGDNGAVSVFKGNVSIRQGQTFITADEVQHFRQDGKKHMLTALGSPDNPVRLKKVLSSQGNSGTPTPEKSSRESNEWVEGIADRMDYDGNTETVILLGHAVVKKWQDDILTDQLQGARIVYDLRHELVSAQAQINGDGKDDASRSVPRVRALIVPK